MSLLTPALKRARLEQAAPYVHGAVLDLGCGPADMLELARDRITAYTGVENNPRSLLICRRRYPNESFFQRNLETEPIDAGGPFDVIVMTAVIEHIRNQAFLLGQFSALLKPGGCVVITSPVPFAVHYVHRFGAFLGFFSQEAADTHEAPCTRRRLEALAGETGLRMKVYRRFQCGMNQLAVLESVSEPKP